MKKAALDPITLKNDEFFLPEEGGLGGGSQAHMST